MQEGLVEQPAARHAVTRLPCPPRWVLTGPAQPCRSRLLDQVQLFIQQAENPEVANQNSPFFFEPFFAIIPIPFSPLYLAKLHHLLQTRRSIGIGMRGAGRGRGGPRGRGGRGGATDDVRAKISTTRREEAEIKELEARIAEEGPLPGEVDLKAKEFTELPLSRYTRTGLERGKFRVMTQMQRIAIPHALAGRDILGAAKTGSGKTLGTSCYCSVLVPQPGQRRLTILHRGLLLRSLCRPGTGAPLPGALDGRGRPRRAHRLPDARARAPDLRGRPHGRLGALWAVRRGHLRGQAARRGGGGDLGDGAARCNTRAPPAAPGAGGRWGGGRHLEQVGASCSTWSRWACVGGRGGSPSCCPPPPPHPPHRQTAGFSASDLRVLVLDEA